MNQDTLDIHIAVSQTAADSHRAILARTREIWRKANALYIGRYEYDAISDFFEWIKSYHPHSIWASVFYRDGVRSFSIDGDKTTLTVQDTFRSETDSDDFTIPTAWLHADDIDAVLAADLDRLQDQFVVHEERKAADAEAERRAEYESLKSEFENDPTRAP